MISEATAVPAGEFSSAGTQISGIIDKVTSYNRDDGHCVIQVKLEDQKYGVSVAGYAPFLYPGMKVIADLKPTDAQKEMLLSENPGVLTQTFGAKNLEFSFPTTAKSVKKFLKSTCLSGIGNHLIQVLSKSFPEDLFEVLENRPHSLLKVEGIGKKRQHQLLALWHEYKMMADLQGFLFANDLPLSWSEVLWANHGEQGKKFLLESPYQAVKILEFEFDRVDAFVQKQIALKQMDLASDPMGRVRAALVDELRNSYKQGQCAVPEKKFLSVIREKLKIDEELLEQALELEMMDENFLVDEIRGVPCIYLKNVWDIEQNVARHFLSFEHRELPWGWFNFQKVLHWAQSLLNIQLAPLQTEAIEKALSSPLTVITGGPGTGKTTLIRSLVTILKTQSSVFTLCSPTGRAAQRLEQATEFPAQTIHRLLKYNSLTGGFQYNKSNPLKVDLVLIDEISMVDLMLMNSLLEALPPHCALILVGDVDQIPPIGAGHILQSLIQSKRFATVKLEEIFRQSDKSLIKANARLINQGKLPDISEDSGDFHYIPMNGVEDIERKLEELVTKTLPEKYGIVEAKDFQILVPMNRGNLGTHALNRHLQKFLGSNGAPRPKTVTGAEQTFKVGDKVMVTKNDYRKEVFNGDIGFIRSIDHFEQLIDIQFDHRPVFFSFDELDRLTLAYAISIHKSQGSEYRAVIVVIAEEHLSIAQRQLIYTAITRGKEQVFLLAEPEALRTALSSDENNMRWEKLSELLT